MNFGVNTGVIRWTDYFGQVVFGTLLFVLLLPHRELYDPHRFFRFRQVALAIMRAAATWLLAYMALSWLLRGDGEISRVFVTIAFFVTTTTFTLWRYALFKFVSDEPVAQRLRQRILFVGWSEHAQTLARSILRDSRHPYQIAGYPSRPRRRGAPGWSLRKLGRLTNWCRAAPRENRRGDADRGGSHPRRASRGKPLERSVDSRCAELLQISSLLRLKR